MPSINKHICGVRYAGGIAFSAFVFIALAPASGAAALAAISVSATGDAGFFMAKAMNHCSWP